MRTDLDHLPAAKQREIERIVEVIFDEFRQATENGTGRRKRARQGALFKHYRTSEEELTRLGARVEELGHVVHQVCTDRIAELERAVARA